jgi:hypothetical protein
LALSSLLAGPMQRSPRSHLCFCCCAVQEAREQAEDTACFYLLCMRGAEAAKRVIGPGKVSPGRISAFHINTMLCMAGILLLRSCVPCSSTACQVQAKFCMLSTSQAHLHADSEVARPWASVAPQRPGMSCMQRVRLRNFWGLI